jgi:hypothetical protein
VNIEPPEDFAAAGHMTLDRGRFITAAAAMIAAGPEEGIEPILHGAAIASILSMALDMTRALVDYERRKL